MLKSCLIWGPMSTSDFTFSKVSLENFPHKYVNAGTFTSKAFTKFFISPNLIRSGWGKTLLYLQPVSFLFPTKERPLPNIWHNGVNHDSGSISTGTNKRAFFPVQPFKAAVSYSGRRMLSLRISTCAKAWACHCRVDDWNFSITSARDQIDINTLRTGGVIQIV